MKLLRQTQEMFDIPENHLPRVLIGGGTDLSVISGMMKEMMPEEALKDMDENTSKAGLPIHPVFIAILGGTDGHLHAEMRLPLQDWQGSMYVEPSILKSKDLQRITDWCAGFLEVFCMNGTVTAYNLDNEQLMLGEVSSRFDLPQIITKTLPQKEVRGLGMESIGTVDEILGQLSKPGIDAINKEQTRTPVSAEAIKQAETELSAEKKEVAIPEPTPAPKAVKEPKKMDEAALRKSQQNILKKYGWAAVVDLTTRMNLPILVEEPKP